MILYHSSSVEVRKPDTAHSRLHLYNSETANLIEECIADLHCRSDKYLAEEIWLEYQEALNLTSE